MKIIKILNEETNKLINLMESNRIIEVNLYKEKTEVEKLGSEYIK